MQDNKKLVKELTQKLKENRDIDFRFERISIVKKPQIDEKIVTKANYRELVVLYESIKNKDGVNIQEIENIIEGNEKKFPYLYKCNQSIYNFVVELRCNGPYYIAKEMTRQGKEIQRMQQDIEKYNKTLNS